MSAGTHPTVDEEKTERGFKVQDKRRFGATGEAREADESDESAAPATEPTADAPRARPEEAHAGEHDLPPMTFSTFVISLSTQALFLLGEIADPKSDDPGVDLAGAKQLIDVLGILDEKTKGNLDSAEQSLLENILYNLRMQYVERARAK